MNTSQILTAQSLNLMTANESAGSTDVSLFVFVVDAIIVILCICLIEGVFLFDGVNNDTRLNVISVCVIYYGTTYFQFNIFNLSLIYFKFSIIIILRDFSMYLECKNR